MIRTSFLAILAVVALGGCMTDGYSYRGGRGDYYYGQPTIEYRHYGYGVPYGSLGYGYYEYGYGYPYGYYDYPYGYYGPGYYYVPRPQYPPTQPPPQDPDRSDLSVKDWAEQHGYPLSGSVQGGNNEGNPFDANRRLLQVAAPDSNPANNPLTRANAPSHPPRSMVHPSRPATPTVTPSRPRASTRAVSPSRALPTRPSSTRSSSGSRSDADEDIRLRMRRP